MSTLCYKQVEKMYIMQLKGFLELF